MIRKNDLLAFKKYEVLWFLIYRELQFQSCAVQNEFNKTVLRQKSLLSLFNNSYLFLHMHVYAVKRNTSHVKRYKTLSLYGEW